MHYDSSVHHRRSVRLKDYDYSDDRAYFVTICTHMHETLFGAINDDGVMVLNTCGKIVGDEWRRTAVNRPYVELDTFVVMPNHVHGIIVITTPHEPHISRAGAQRAAPLQPKGVTPNNVAPGSLGAIVRAFKSAATNRINMLRNTPGAPVWQRNYHDVIIRSPAMLDTLRQYIETNPTRWAADRYNPLHDFG